jgi:fructokinase
MVMVIGEILLDVFPDYTRLGGASFNYALHLVKLGIPMRFISRIGDDDYGGIIRERLNELRFPMSDIQIDRSRPTGRVFVELNKAGIPSFSIMEDTAFDYIALNEDIKNILKSGVNFLYYGTLIQRSRNGFDLMRKVLQKKDEKTVCLYDINLRKGCFNEKVIMESISRCDILKMNDDELKVIKLIHGSKTADDRFIRFLMKEYSIVMTAVTMGAMGSFLYTGGKKFRIKPEKITDIADTVGAGDAYAAALTAGFLKGWEPDVIARGATMLSSEICRVRGAIPEDGRIYRRILDLPI